MSPQISVICPVGAREVYLVEALESVLAQDFRDFELLVVLDGSPERVAAIVDGFDDPRIRVVRLPVNLGISTARNVGLALARAPYVAYMDSDDVALAHRLSVQHAWLQAHPEVTACGSNCIKLFVDGRRAPMVYPASDGQIKARLLLVDSALHNPTVMVRTDFLRRHGLRFDPNFTRDQSHRLFVEMMCRGAVFHGLQEELLIYRRHTENVTHDQSGVDDEKTRVREILAPLFFPELTGHEQGLLLKGLRQQVDMSLEELCRFVAVVDKARAETRVFRGEDRAELRLMLRLFRDRALRGLGVGKPAGSSLVA